MTCKCSVTSLYKNIDRYIDTKVFFTEICVLFGIYLEVELLDTSCRVHSQCALESSGFHVTLVYGDSWTRSDFQSISDGMIMFRSPPSAGGTLSSVFTFMMSCSNCPVLSLY